MANKYKIPMTFNDIESQDLTLESDQSIRYKNEIDLFKRTSELYISLFSNSRRLHLEKGKVDYIQLIAVRIFQDIRSAFLLTLKGLYPQAGSLLRGVLDSVNLIYDFKINPDHEDMWFNSGKNKRKELFKTGTVRKRVEDSGITKSSPSSKGLYGLLSDFSVHINMESHLWYIELKDHTLLYHWAGYDGGKKADALMVSVLQALAEGLFVLVYEDIYAIDRDWGNEFKIWKKDFLIFTMKFGKIFGNQDVKNWKVLEDKEVVVNFD